MAPINPAAWLQNRTDHPAQLFRMAMAGASMSGGMIVGATSPAGGVHPAFGGRLAVTGTAGMNVSVNTGLVYMPGSTAWQGMYAGYNSAAYTVAVPAASSTQWRSDYIVARQLDTAFGGGSDTWDIIDVQGTNSSSSPGSLPTLPNNCVPLAIIRVTPNMTVTNGGGTVVDARTYLPLPGPIFTTSANQPSLSCPEGTMWFETDTNKLGIIINGARQYVLTTSSNSVDPWHSLSGLTFANGWNLSADLPQSGYRKNPADPNMMDIMISMNAGTLADNTVVLTMPSGYRVSANWQRLPLMCGGGSSQAPFLRFATDGTVVCIGLTSGISNAYINGTIRLQ